MQSGDLIHERYRLDGQLGSGGMAEVWRASDERLQRFVAIKFPAPNLADDPEFLVRFFSEAQAVARLSHPNVVEVLDFGEFEGRSYLVMEHVPGGSLEDVDRPMDAARARELIREAALGAGAAHAEGIVHRDIKPANILIDEQGSAKLADFGIAATAVSEKLTATGAAIGSPHYISPEQASGGTATSRSDVYALGVVLYELLTGVRPIDADNLAAIAIAQVEREPARPSEHVAIDPELEAVVMRCLAKDPDARYEDGAALATALDVPRTAAIAAAAEPPLTEATISSIEADEGETIDLGPARSSRLRWVLAGAAIVILLTVLGIALFATSSPEKARAGAHAHPTKISPSPTHRRHRRTPSPESTSDGSGVVAPPSVAPSPSKRANPGGSSSNKNGRGNGSSSNAGHGRPGGRPRPSSTPRASSAPTPAASPS